MHVSLRHIWRFVSLRKIIIVMSDSRNGCPFDKNRTQIFQSYDKIYIRRKTITKFGGALESIYGYIMADNEQMWDEENAIEIEMLYDDEVDDGNQVVGNNQGGNGDAENVNDDHVVPNIDNI